MIFGNTAREYDEACELRECALNRQILRNIEESGEAEAMERLFACDLFARRHARGKFEEFIGRREMGEALASV